MDSDSGDRQDVQEAIVALLPPLLDALESLGVVARHLHPPRLGALMQAVGARDQPLRAALDAFRGIAWPDRLRAFRDQADAAASAACLAFDGLRAAVEAPDGVVQAYRALRHVARAQEALYPIASLLLPVSRYFLEPAARDDAALLAKLAHAGAGGPVRVGVLHAGNERGMRGGFSLYVPEYYDPTVAYPLIVALHGGSGNGRAFLWTWLREARSRGAILLSPTAVGPTWSLMEPELDAANINRIVAQVRQEWRIDSSRLLLTGMSDGGTFSLLSGLRADSPFTHLAPISASFHPFLLELADADRLRGLPIHLVHGALDWMFPVMIARNAQQALRTAGAAVTYREIADLSHTYPRDANPLILDWVATMDRPPAE